MTVTACPNCERPAIPSDSPQFDSLKNVLPEYLTFRRTCVECFDAETKATSSARFSAVGRTFANAGQLNASAALSRLYEDRERDRAARRPVVAPVAPTRDAWTVEDVDLRSVLSDALTLPSLASVAARVPDFTVNKTTNRGGSSGWFRAASRRVHVTLRRGSTAHDSLGVLLHELCHAACHAESLGFHDDDPDFAAKCREVMDEWTATFPDRPVDHTVHGAYRGENGRRNKAELARRKAAFATLSPEQRATIHVLAKTNPELANRFLGRTVR